MRIFYFKIAHLLKEVMTKTEIFDNLLHGEIGVGEVAVGKISVGEISGWGNCCWGSCAGEMA